MRATFQVAGDGEFPNPNYDIDVMFNGMPGVVVLEVNEVTFSGSSDGPSVKHAKNVMRTILQASQARAIASAMLSAATEAKK